MNNMKRDSFEVFKSNVCHKVKDIGELDFIAETLYFDEIKNLYEKHWFSEALYLLAMVDYLSRKNGIPVCANYNKMRSCKLDTVIYPSSIIMQYNLSHDESILQNSFDKAIPEFKRFNIVENEVENIA